MRMFDFGVDVGEIPKIVLGEVEEIKEILLLLIMVLLFEKD